MKNIFELQQDKTVNLNLNIQFLIRIYEEPVLNCNPSIK